VFSFVAVMGEEEDTRMDATCQSWVQESANAAATVKVRIIEGEASDHSGDCSLNPENVVLSVSSNMRSSHKSRELEVRFRFPPEFGLLVPKPPIYFFLVSFAGISFKNTKPFISCWSWKLTTKTVGRWHVQKW